MIDKALLDEVRSFMRRNEKAYLELLKCLRVHATTAATRLGKDVVRDIYSRGSKQDEDEFKLPARIAEKVSIKRSDGPFPIQDLNDIVGLTVTVAYHENIQQFIEELKRVLTEDVAIFRADVKSARGYHATHLDCRGLSGEPRGLICEIQVKTALHDLWGSKTHDLTYKPGSALDLRLQSLMTIAGDMLQAVELQSSEIRRLILADLDSERETRQVALMHLMDVEVVCSKRNTDQRLIDFAAELASLDAHLAICPEDDKTLNDLRGKVRGLCQDDISVGWISAFDLARTRPSDSTIRVASGEILALAEDALSKLQNGHVSAADALVIAGMALYAIGNLNEAIELGYRTYDLPIVPPAHRLMIVHNLADYLVEREYYNPTRDERRRQQQKQEIERLHQIGKTGDPEIDDSSEGFFTLTFSDDPSEIRAAIAKCQAAATFAMPGEEHIAEQYSELYVRLGWRKLFRVMQLRASS